jgi:hypothetical protein
MSGVAFLVCILYLVWGTNCMAKVFLFLLHLLITVIISCNSSHLFTYSFFIIILPYLFNVYVEKVGEVFHGCFGVFNSTYMSWLLFVGGTMDNDPSSVKELFVEPQKGCWLVSECSFLCQVQPCH